MKGHHARSVLTRRRFAGLAAAAAAAWAGAGPARAQDYPTRLIKVVVPFTPGGASDVVGRIVSQKLSERLKQPIVIENRAGAGGNVGAESVARAEPDGYTLLAGALGAHAINMTLTRNTVRFDIVKDFEPIALTGVVPVSLIVRKDLPVANAAEFLRYAKERPGQLTYASAGNGSTQHLAGELFKHLTGTDLRHVPYRGSAPAVNDLLAGQVDVTFETGPAALGPVQGGLLRALLIAYDKRLPELPNVPTAAEAGVPGFEVSGQYGFWAPAGTPKPIVDLLNREISAILPMPDVKDKLAAQGAFVVPSTPASMREHVGREVAKWAKVIADAGLPTQ